jgi:hypothetical protein
MNVRHDRRARLERSRLGPRQAPELERAAVTLDELDVGSAMSSRRDVEPSMIGTESNAVFRSG